MTGSKKLKLSYFNIKGLAEAIRLTLFVGNIEFEDERVSFEEFASRKASLPFKQLPTLDIDDGQVILTQSGAILRYAGILAGLYPSEDPLLAAQVDQVLAVIYDLAVAMRPTYAVEDPIAKAALRKEIAVKQISPLLECLDTVLTRYEKASGKNN